MAVPEVKYKAKFEYMLSNTKIIIVEATCSDVTYYTCENLELKFYAENGIDDLEVVYDKLVFEEIEIEAEDKLHDVKYDSGQSIGY